MLPPTNTTIPSNSQGTVSQELRINNNMQGEKSIILKLKFSYKSAGKNIDELISVSSFPPLY